MGKEDSLSESKRKIVENAKKKFVEKVFMKYDTAGDGKLNKEQLKMTLLEIIKSGNDAAFITDKKMLDDDDVLRMFIDVADRDGDKLVNLKELLIILELGD